MKQMHALTYLKGYNIRREGNCWIQRLGLGLSQKDTCDATYDHSCAVLVGKLDQILLQTNLLVGEVSEGSVTGAARTQRPTTEMPQNKP